MTSPRFWLSLVYLFATLVAQVPHDHRQGSEPAGADARDDCADLGRHVAGHEADAHHVGPELCPICQLRFDSPLLVAAPTPAIGPGVAIAREAGPPAAPPRPLLRPSCRAPPLDPRV